MQGKLIIISAPSGSGKTTIVRELLKEMPMLSFSISAASREPRGEEINGKDYHFLGVEGFKKAINENAFLEWEEVYPNQFYGTLKSEVERIWNQNKVVIFDIDVVGGLNLKKQYGAQALSIFIQPPSIEELENRLRNRSTETEEKINIRLSKSAQELEKASEFDIVITNDALHEAIANTKLAVENFISSEE